MIDIKESILSIIGWIVIIIVFGLVFSFGTSFFGGNL
ncbi:hypothetical protein R80B4_02309 [Fibrobacteres bacterium R8-0-B4]